MFIGGRRWWPDYNDAWNLLVPNFYRGDDRRRRRNPATRSTSVSRRSWPRPRTTPTRTSSSS